VSSPVSVNVVSGRLAPDLDPVTDTKLSPGGELPSKTLITPAAVMAPPVNVRVVPERVPVRDRLTVIGVVMSAWSSVLTSPSTFGSAGLAVLVYCHGGGRGYRDCAGVWVMVGCYACRPRRRV
jgi:hypothetical protein